MSERTQLIPAQIASERRQNMGKGESRRRLLKRWSLMGGTYFGDKLEIPKLNVVKQGRLVWGSPMELSVCIKLKL